jgi:2-alkyl-3-oxoalkanoate reductase
VTTDEDAHPIQSLDNVRHQEDEMRVLVIGATGAIGRQLVPRLTAAGHEVIASSRMRPATPFEGARFCPLDLLDDSAVRQLVADIEPHAIVHQATALTGLGNNLRRFDAGFTLTNRLRTEGTASLLRAATALDPLPRLVVQSFCGWPWAPTGGLVKSETDPLDPNPPKAFRRTFRALVEMEQMVTAYPNGVVLRYGGFYGPGASLSAGGAQLEALRTGKFPLVGDAGGVWSFVHVGDAADAAVLALERGSGTYNIVDDDPAPVSEWLPVLARLAGGRPPRRIPVWLARLAGGPGLVHLMTTTRGSSNRKARAELGWQPAHPSWREGFAADLAGSTARDSKKTSRKRRPGPSQM